MMTNKKLYRLFILSLIIAVIRSSDSGARSWSYSSNSAGPETWSNITDSTCKGVRQSPIPITKSETQYWSVLKKIHFVNADKNISNIMLKNTGSSVAMTFSGNLSIKFGGDGNIVPEQLHWHWGSNNNTGSEHSLDGNFYPIEGHFVCYNKQLYPDFKTAASKASGLYVIGFFYELGPKNIALQSLLDYFTNITEPFTSVSIPGLEITGLLPSNLQNYYRYEGSLTTPPCTQNVIWSILDSRPTISEDQLNEFRKLKFGPIDQSGNMMNNVRNLQSIVDRSDYIPRVVYSSFKASSNKINWSIILQTVCILFSVYFIY